MKSALKQGLAAAGFALQRLPAGIPTGLYLERDLALVVGSRPGAVCFDVGANRGDFVAQLLAALPVPQVHAFEPAPAAFARLEARHKQVPGVQLVNRGVSDAPGELVLQTFDNDALNSFLPFASGGGQHFGGARPLSTQAVPVVTLDDYARTAGLGEIDLLKIDTQGFELRVLQGAVELLRARRVRSVLLELNFLPLYESQASPTDVIAFLRAHDLQLVDFYEKCRKGNLLGWCTALFTRHSPSSVLP